MINNRRTKGCALVAAALALLLSGPAVAQNSLAEPSSAPSIAVVASPLALEIRPAFGLPLGESGSSFSLGGALDVGLRYRLPGSILAAIGGIEYGYLPDKASKSISAAALRAGASVALPIAGSVELTAQGTGGYYFAAYNDFSLSAGNPYLAGGLGLRFPIGPALKLDVGAQYAYYLGLYQGLSAGVGIGIPLGNLGGSIGMGSIELRPAFPVFYKHYDDHPIGSVELRSSLKVPATDIRIRVFVKEYMDAPKTVALPGALGPGAVEKVELYALFNDKVLGITEGTKAAAELTVEYQVEGRGYQDRQVETLSLMGRNAMTWDDNRKAAAYVTAKEPQVLDFARNITSYVHSKETRSIADSLQSAVALHEALDLYGVNYTPNPVTPYSEASRDKAAVDFLQFPRETLKYRAGDCSDLSILYASLLQAVGIDTAFITVPGHIFVAVSTGVASDRAPDSLIAKGMFIDRSGRAWIPVEITARHQGFLKAWQLGAKEWEEGQAAGQAGFYPVQEAWAAYQPVGLPGAGDPIALPQSDQVLAAYQRELQKCIEASVGPRIAELQAAADSGKDFGAMNSLGVLYAKYGQADKAAQVFKRILASKPYLPALINLGNICFQREDWKAALDYYGQADDLAPNTPRIVLAMARANRELRNYEVAAKGLERLKALDPGLAAQYAYLSSGPGEGTRASDIGSERERVFWEGGQ
jgi:tetratricopeptide (TPR) repeat protein